MTRTHCHPARPIVAVRKGSINSYPNFLKEEPRPKVSCFDDDGPGEKSQSGPRHDNDHVYVHDMDILPTIDECLSTTRLPWMPKRNVNAGHFMQHGYARHIDTQFRLLRHDSVEKIRDMNYKAAQEAFLPNAAVRDACREEYLESSCGHRFFLYHNVRMEAVVPDECEGVTLQLSYDCPASLRNRNMYKSARFERGMLCSVLQLDHDTNELMIHYFNIQRRLSTHSLDGRNGYGLRAAVELSMLPHISKEVQEDTLSIITSIRSNTTMALVEYPKLLYAGFANVLYCLQNMTDFDYAFGHYISPRQEQYDIGHEQKLKVQPPSYSKCPNFSFNLQPLTGRTDSQFSLVDLVGERKGKSLDHLATHTTLEAGQATALLSSLNREFAFTQGPPGCGKTYLGIALTRVLLASRSADRKLPILLICHTNHALDAFMIGLRDAGVEKLMRIGNSSKEDWTKAINLKGLAKEEKSTYGERSARRRVDVEKDHNYAHLEAWCKGLSGEVLTGFPCWQHVSSIVNEEYPRVYSQLCTAANEPRVQAFTYDYWAKGGDLSTIESLRNELLKRLNYSADIGDHGSSASLQATTLLTSIADFTRLQTLDAGENDVWRLPLQQRQELLRQWQGKINKKKITSKLCKVHDRHKQLLGEARKLRDQKDIRIIRKQNVVGMTTSACAGRWALLRQVGFEILICEEAGEVLEPHTLCCLLPTLNHAINVGDPLQLRPEVEEQTLTLETSQGKDYRLDESLFERIMQPLDCWAKTIPTTKLNVQRRMHPDIADLCRITYPFLRDYPTTIAHPIPRGFHHRMWWLHHDMPEDDAAGLSRSITNTHEVGIVKGLVAYLLRGSDYSPGDIAVITPYAGQVVELRNALSQNCAVWMSEKDKDTLVDCGAIEPDTSELDEQKQLSVPMKDLLRLATIDNFQGEEAKVIILSTVRSGPKLGFVKTPNRINVMCSRAKHGFYVVGNAHALKVDAVWRSIIGVFVAKRAISNAIRLQCDRHPEYYTFANSAESFVQFTQCEIPCNQKLDCGHLCTEPCHDSSLHGIIPCKNPCELKLNCGHRCQKSCGERCGPCEKKRRRYQRSCGHRALELCSGDPMPCDHFEGYLTLSCGRHAIGYTCGEQAKSFACDAVCGEELPCGHACIGTCGICETTQDHTICRSTCGKDIACGHKCAAICHGEADCPPCEQICQSSCSHSMTRRKCNEALVPCLQTVLASGPYGWVQQTLCCLTAGLDRPYLLEPRRVHSVLQPALKIFDAKLEEVSRQVEDRGKVLERTSYLMILHFQEMAQNTTSVAMAAPKIIQRSLSHGDGILEVEKEVSALRNILDNLEHGVKAVERAYSCRLPGIPESTKLEVHRIGVCAALARARDAKSMACFLLQSQDPSQQMQRAAPELFLFAKALLHPLVNEFSDVERTKLKDVIAKCQALLEEVETKLSG